MIELGNAAALAWLLALVPAGAAAWYAARRRRSADAAFGGASQLRLGRSGARRALQAALLLGALALIAVAAARPQWGSEERELTRLGIDVAVALDISRSMTATDVEPSRAEAAALGLDEMLDHLRGDRVGLVTFAGGAFERAPLTLDLDPLRQLIERAQNEAALVAQGTDLAGALESATNLLDVEDAAETQVIVLISDGEDVAGGLEEQLERIEDLGIRVFTVAAGTSEGGALAPRAASGDGSEEPPAPTGDAEISRADFGTLEQIAEVSGGNARALDEIVGLAVEFQRLRQSAFDESSDDAPIERFQWFLGGALVLLAAQMLVADGGRERRRWGTVPGGRLVLGGAALVLLALLAACGSAVYRDVERGNDAYEDGEYEAALSAYQEAAAEQPDAPELQYNIGNSLHRLGRYEEATVASTTAMNAAVEPELFARSAYAVGSHAFRRGDLEAARDALVSALLREPGDADAKHNLEVVLRAIAGEQPDEVAAQPPTPTPTPDGGDGEQPGPPDDSAGPTGEEGDPADQGDPPDEGGDAPDGDGEQQPEDGPSGDDQPSDPGDPQSGEEQGQTLEDAQVALSEALLELGDEALSLDDALGILDLVRRVNSLEALEPGPGGPGALPDR